MAFGTRNTQATVIPFFPAAQKTQYWTVADHFTAASTGPHSNQNFAPATLEGAVTSDRLLEFLYGVAQTAN